jgi:preprotein translocase subunit SecA
MRIFGSDRMESMLTRLGLKDGEAIIHPWVNKALEKAQQKVEARNFDIRKNLLKYDNVMNDQRKVIYEQRRDLMRANEVSQTVTDMRHEMIDGLVARFMPEKSYPEQWDTKGLHEECRRLLGIDLPVDDWAKEEGIDDAAIRERVVQASDRKMAEKAANFGPEVMRMAEKSLLLQLLDQSWKDHLLALDHLRHGIQLRAYGQRDPLNEYKREAFEMFEGMLDRLRETVTGVLCHIEIRTSRPEDALPERRPQPMQESRSDPALAAAGAEPELAMAGGPAPMPQRPAAAPMRRASPVAADPSVPESWGKTSRNAPCPCGSGKKYKNCHGKL